MNELDLLKYVQYLPLLVTLIEKDWPLVKQLITDVQADIALINAAPAAVVVKSNPATMPTSGPGGTFTS